MVDDLVVSENSDQPLASTPIAKVSVVRVASVNSEFAENARNRDEVWMHLTIHCNRHRLANPELGGMSTRWGQSDRFKPGGCRKSQPPPQKKRAI